MPPNARTARYGEKRSHSVHPSVPAARMSVPMYGPARVVWYETVIAFLAEHVLGEEWRRPALV